MLNSEHEKTFTRGLCYISYSTWPGSPTGHTRCSPSAKDYFHCNSSVVPNV